MDVRGISGQKAAADAESIDDATVDAKRRHPVRIADACPRESVGIEQVLESLDGPRGIVRIDRATRVDQPPAPRLRQREGTDLDFVGKDHCGLIVRLLPVDPDVGEEEGLLVFGPLERQVQLAADGASRPVAPDEPA